MDDRIVPEDPANPGYDVLIGEIGTRTHYIHCVMASTTEPLAPAEIGKRAEMLARAGGYLVKPTTFSSSVTSSHLASMRDKVGRGFAEQVGGGRWQLTARARQRIAAALAGPSSDRPATPIETPLPEEVGDASKLVEGAVRTITVNAYERNPEARQRCIAAHGENCSACGMSFGAEYGPVADGYIHVHHLRPLSEVRAAKAVDPVADLRPICPNCHAVVHRRVPPYSVEEVRAFWQQRHAEPNAAVDRGRKAGPGH